jgi:hypothetical protein
MLFVRLAILAAAVLLTVAMAPDELWEVVGPGPVGSAAAEDGNCATVDPETGRVTVHPASCFEPLGP